MKNILPKIPPFIYSLIVLSTLLVTLLSYILNNIDPESSNSKLMFSFVLFIASLITLPTIRTLFLLAEGDEYTDLRAKFRIFFSENILFSVVLGVLMLLKTYGFLNFFTLLSLISIYLGITFAYQKLRKPKRIKRI